MRLRVRSLLLDWYERLSDGLAERIADRITERPASPATTRMDHTITLAEDADLTGFAQELSKRLDGIDLHVL
ncbi:hypothetical protein [Nocardia xishanensis]